MKRYQANGCFVLREIAGEAVLVPVGDAGSLANSMISLNATALFLWKLLEQPRTVDDLIQKAKQAYADPEGKLEEDIRRLTLEYVKIGLFMEVE